MTPDTQRCARCDCVVRFAPVRVLVLNCCYSRSCCVVHCYFFHFVFQLKKSHETVVGDLGHRLNVLTGELSLYASREPEYLLASKTLQGKLDRAEIEVKRLTRQYEAARRKADFLESSAHQGLGGGGGGGAVQPLSSMHMPLQSATGIINQAQPSQQINPMLSSSVGRAGLASAYQPLPFAQSMLPPTRSKKL